MNEEDLNELANSILREMYASAEPPLDFDEAAANPDEMDDDWYEQHYLPEDEQERIFEKHTDDEELTNSEHLSLTMTCILDLGPTSTPVES